MVGGESQEHFSICFVKMEHKPRIDPPEEAMTPSLTEESSSRTLESPV